jgi:hypothetical protein
MVAVKFLWTSSSLIFAATIVVACAALGFVAWRRSHFKPTVGWMELFRLLLISLVAITFTQPEFLEEHRPPQNPTLVVLYDESGSMATEDVVQNEKSDPESKQPALQSRSEWLSPIINKSWWLPVSNKLDLVLEPFSSPAPDGKNGTNLHLALTQVVEKYDNLRGIVLLSDGDWNLGEPPSLAASRLRAKQIPVFSVVVGSELRQPDLEISRLDVPTFGVTGKQLRIPVAVQSALPRDFLTTISLTPSTGNATTETVSFPGMSQWEDILEWTPDAPGDYLLTLSVPPNEDEKNVANNQRSVKITIRDETIKVLLVESVPRWEYRYLRNALDRDPGVDVACLLFHPSLGKTGSGHGYLPAFPATQEELSKFDVIFLGDVGIDEGQLTLEQCKAIKGLIQNQASGLIFMPGMRGNQLSLAQSELEPLYPVVMDHSQPKGWVNGSPARFELTEPGRHSLLTKLEDMNDANSERWENLPGFHWYAPVVRAKSGSEVLAIHGTETGSQGAIPLLVTKTFGTGKVLFLGTDNAWRWREGVEDKYHYRFWGQVARWMAYQRNMAKGEKMRLFHSPERPQQGGMVMLNANVMGDQGEPLAEGHVNVTLKAPSGATETIRLQGQNNEWGLFTGRFTPAEVGEYQVVVSCRENGASLETSIGIEGTMRERLGQPARSDVLSEISTLTGGKVAQSDNVRELLQVIQDLPEPEPMIRRLRLWCHPAWIGSMILLFGTFWTLRKITGSV